MYKKTYDHSYLEKLDDLFERTKTKSLELLSPSPGEVIVDVGCGVGNDIRKIAESGANIYGIDHDPNLIDIAKRNISHNHRIKFINCEANKIPLDSNSVDKIRFDRVLQHIENHHDIVTETSRLLKKNGEFHIVDVDYFSLSVFLPNQILERKLIDAMAFGRFKGGWKIRNLPDLLKTHNFQITHSEIQNYIFDDNETINYLNRFNKIIADEFEQKNVTEAEMEYWNNFKASQMKLSLNLLLIVAKKSNPMIELIEETVNKIDSLIQAQLPESKYQFELFDLTTNTKHFRGLDEPFHWGSVYKLFVVAEIIKMIDEGLIKADDKLILHRGKYTHGIGILKFFSHLDHLTFLDACKMVMATSDGLCADELLAVVGFERLSNLFNLATCTNSKLTVNLDTMVNNLFAGIDLKAGADFYLSDEYFEHFDTKLAQLLEENYTTVQDLNRGFHFVLTEYLPAGAKELFMECLFVPSIHTRIAQYTHLSKFSLLGKTGALAFGNANNECVSIIKKSNQQIYGHFALNTKCNKKRNFQSNDTFGLIGLEIAKLYERLHPEA